MPTPLGILNLPNLPHDVICEVIKVGLESIDGMRLISHTWNDLVTDHLNHRRHLPVIEKLCWEREESTSILQLFTNPPKRNEEAYWRVVISVQKRYRSYFGLDSWSESISYTIESDDFEEYSKLFKRFNAVKMSICERLTHLCKRTSHIEKLCLDKHLHEKCVFLKNALSGFPVKQLFIGKIELFERERAEMILDFARANSVQHLQLVFLGFAWAENRSDLETCLSEAARTVPSITLTISDLRIPILCLLRFAQLEEVWEKRMSEIVDSENVLITVECKDLRTGRARICLVRR